MAREQSNEGYRCEECGGLYGPESSCGPCPYCVIERLEERARRTAEWLNEAYGRNLDDWPEVFWWIRGAGKAK